ncbi:MAG: DUF1013 domain-containing protein [Rhodobacteraceae bacterium]|nr:DUF1013 domain-containing protein [Paracoccaceae bacterium]
MERKPIMATATAVWLIDQTGLTFRQIAAFCGMHTLEVQSIADGDSARGILGFDPIANSQLDKSEIEKGEADPEYRLQLKDNSATFGDERLKGKKYTPLSRREDRPAAISWLLKNHRELSHAQIAKLIGTTSATIRSISDRTHWNINNIQPTDPVALGLCKQLELDQAVRISSERAEKERIASGKEPGATIQSTEESLRPETSPQDQFSKLQEFRLDGA